MSDDDLTIVCEDCGITRHFKNAAHARFAKRCKPCQKKHINKKQRDRYRKKKGIPLDAPVSNMIKPSKPQHKSAWLTPKKDLSIDDDRDPQKVAEIRAHIEKMFDLIDDNSTTDDW